MSSILKPHDRITFKPALVVVVEQSISIICYIAAHDAKKHAITVNVR